MFASDRIEKVYRRIQREGGRALNGRCPICERYMRLEAPHPNGDRFRVCANCDRIEDWPRFS